MRFILVWCFLQFDISVVIVKIVPIFTLFFRTVLLKFYIKKYYPEVDYTVRPTDSIEGAANRWDALLLQISINTSTSLPAILISSFLGFKEANVYAIYSMIASSIISVVSALSSGVAPKLGQNLALGQDICHTYKVYDYIVSVVITVVFSVMAVMALPFVDLYTNVVDDINYIYPIYSVLIAVWAALHTYRIPFTAIINASGLYKENRINNIVNLFVQVVGGVILTSFFGVTGMLVSMILTAVHRNISFSVIINRNHSVCTVGNSLIKQLLIVLTVLLSFGILSPIVNNFNYSFVLWIVISMAVFIVEAIIAVLLFSVVDIKTSGALFLKLKNTFKKLSR